MDASRKWIDLLRVSSVLFICYCLVTVLGGSIAEWLVCWTRAHKGPGSNRNRDPVGCRCIRQTVHTNCASVHQAAKLVAALLRVAGVTAGLAESNGSLPPGFIMTHITCRLTAKNRDKLRYPTLGNRVWATFTFLQLHHNHI